MSEGGLAGALEEGGGPVAQYRAAAETLLADDSDLQRAMTEWASFLRASHGDVFAGVDHPNPAERAFVDALAYDFVVDRLLRRAERTFGVSLANPEAHHDADAQSVAFRPLHDRVCAAGGVDPAVEDRLLADGLGGLGVGDLCALYEHAVSREVRLALGAYYTPRGVAELAVDALSVEDVAGASFLDPACGAGAFLSVCVERKVGALSDDLAPPAAVTAITDAVVGIDLDPVAVRAAKLAYVVALGPLVRDSGVEELAVPVVLGDAVGLRQAADPGAAAGVDPTATHLVGNPPWITWQDLPEERKAGWRDGPADRLSLVPHDGAAARLGHANDDVSLPFVWACVDRYLAEGGDAAFVLKRDAMKGPAGRLLRTGAVDDRPLAVRRIHDFGDLRPFGPQSDADAAVYALSAGEHRSFPVETTAWRRGAASPDYSSAAALRSTLEHERTAMVPVDPDDPSSAWVRRDAERAALGSCDHEIRHGVKDDASDVFGVDRSQLAELESDRVYPYLKSRHLVKFGLFGHDLRLVPIRKANRDNEAELRRQCPGTYDYLDARRERLAERSSSWLDGGPFYNVFGLGEYTWAEYKVVWCRLGFKPHFAVVSTVADEDLGETQVVPGDHCMFLATEDEREAHFLAALLNSAPYQRSLRDVAGGGKSSLSKSVVSRLHLPAYPGTERSERLADLSMRAHDVVAEHADGSKRAYDAATIDELQRLRAAIDRTVESFLADV